MKKTYDDFLQGYPMYKKTADTKHLRELYDTILNTDESIIKMYNQVQDKKPAISAVVAEIENYYDSLPDPDFTIDSKSEDPDKVVKANVTKQTIGVMISSIMKNIGYKNSGKRSLTPDYKKKYFVSGAIFKYVGGGTMRVEDGERIVYL